MEALSIIMDTIAEGDALAKRSREKMGALAESAQEGKKSLKSPPLPVLRARCRPSSTLPKAS